MKNTCHSHTDCLCSVWCYTVVQWLLRWVVVMGVVCCGGAFCVAAGPDSMLYVDPSAAIDNPGEINEWDPVCFPLWLDDGSARYWIKVPVGVADEGKWLSMGWPNIWQWQMISSFGVLFEYPDGTTVEVNSDTQDGPGRFEVYLERKYFVPEAPVSAVLRLECLPYRIYIPSISLQEAEHAWQTQADYSALFALYVGMVGILIAAAVALLVLISDRIFLYYIIMLAGSTMAIYAQVPVYDVEVLSFSNARWLMIFHMMMAVYYIGTLLFTGCFLDSSRSSRGLQRYVRAVVFVFLLYIALYSFMSESVRENLLYGMDLLALSPIGIAFWLWRKNGNRAALYYVSINAMYLPVFLYFVVVTQGSVDPVVPIYFLLIAGALIESIGYSVGVAYRLYVTLEHKQYIEEQNRVLKREQVESVLLARDAELRMLRFQMNPHFLFNALNSLIAEIGECPKHAVKMAQKLSEYLRYTLTAREDIRLEDELEAVRRYLELENFRYEDKLVVHIDIDEGVDDIRIPMFTLQPLVENALKYGMQTSPMPLRVDIHVCREGEMLRVSVSNSGKWVNEQTASTGIGLANIQERLVRRYGDAGCFSWKQKDGAVEVSLVIPIRQIIQ